MTDVPATDLREIWLDRDMVHKLCKQLDDFISGEITAIEYIVWDLARRVNQPAISFDQLKMFFNQCTPRAWLTMLDIDTYCEQSMAAADRFIALCQSTSSLEVHP